MLSPKRITPPASMPITLDEAKAQCRVELGVTDEDSLIEGMIAAATEQLESTLDSVLVSQTWEQRFGAFSHCLRLPKKAVSGVVSVKYYDAGNTLQTLASSSYELLTDAAGSYVSFWPLSSFPDVYERPDAVVVQFTAGGVVADISPSLRAAILLHVAFLYEFRESNLEASVTPTGAYENLIWPFKRTKV
ncbi:hypothetical protein SFHH103_01660 [Sinorhizobium fredii HH103]|uniref:Phage gp6-like head-tail connector protein n=1 Tax=Sinorhizobium fredii (strain HH103) TaxID=1117943 RepID=G9A7C7_SINF1|nr:head-tail connector protein [Sinorhizobium fredii]CCE96157.1 hypothetical protein SFHH103_01660 [Sinorhizobium fredii HH103]